MSVFEIVICIALIPLVIISVIIIGALITSVIQGLLGMLCALLSKIPAAIWRIDESKILEDDTEEVSNEQVNRMDSE